MSARSSTSFGVILSFLFVGCGGAASEPRETTPAREVAEIRPRLVRVSDADTTVYLFGTVHLLEPSTAWMNDEISGALSSSRAVYFEVPTEPEALAPHMPLLQSLALNPPGVTLSSLLPPDARSRAEAAATASNVPFAQLEPMRPWLAAITLSMTRLVARGADPEAGVDRVIAARAREAGQEVRYLEDIPTQLHAIGDLPTDVQVELFVQSLDDIEESDAHFDEMVSAWQRGDTRHLEHELVDEMRTEAPALYDSMLVRRNRAWVEVLTTLMANEPGTFFVAAGAAHFVGPDAVQVGLAQHGLTVQ
ncbi:MAG: TraB/GumN family protein [Deltaproteobacteria bacterium]|nr:TraB/GumN family protein [Deltaproteobacteria bacterium]